MKSTEVGGIVFLTVIAGRKQRDALITLLTDEGARLINVIYGKGTVKPSYLKSALGLVPEENKVVITCLISREKCDETLARLGTEYGFNKPNTGIAFTMRVECISF